jgi:hypothetical protein
MDDLKPQQSLKRIEVVVAVQEFVLGLQTESGDQAIDSLSDRIAACTQVSVVMGCGNSQATACGLKNLEPQEVGLGSRKRALVPNALQYLAKDEVGQPEPLPLQFAVEPTRFRVWAAAQVVDPHGSVDNDHDRVIPRPAPSATG